MESQKEYFEKVFISAGEFPKEEGDYNTDQGIEHFKKDGFYYTVNWWLRPCSPIGLFNAQKQYIQLLEKREQSLMGVMVGRSYGQATAEEVAKGMELRKKIEELYDKYL